MTTPDVPGRASPVWRQARATRLQAALDRQRTLGLAVGIVIARRGCSPTDALTHICLVGQRTGESPDDVAARIVLDLDRPDTGTRN